MYTSSDRFGDLFQAKQTLWEICDWKMFFMDGSRINHYCYSIWLFDKLCSSCQTMWVLHYSRHRWLNFRCNILRGGLQLVEGCDWIIIFLWFNGFAWCTASFANIKTILIVNYWCPKWITWCYGILILILRVILVRLKMILSPMTSWCIHMFIVRSMLRWWVIIINN